MKKILLFTFILIFTLSIALPILAAQTEICPTDEPACKKFIDFPDQWKNKLTIGAIIGGAAVDALNPCEFAILIFLMGTLLLNGERKKALYSGMAFCLAIYLSYLAMGLGLLKIIQNLHISILTMKIVGVLAIIFGLLHLKDYFKYGAGGFIMEVPVSWRPTMKKLAGSVTNPLGAFLIGLLISIFLLPCTAGPYVAILTLLGANSINGAKIILYLLLYNLIFIIPMAIMVGFMYAGLKATEAEEWRKGKIRLLHLIAGIIMIFLGIAIFMRWI